MYEWGWYMDKCLGLAGEKLKGYIGLLTFSLSILSQIWQRLVRKFLPFVRKGCVCVCVCACVVKLGCAPSEVVLGGVVW